MEFKICTPDQILHLIRGPSNLESSFNALFRKRFQRSPKVDCFARLVVFERIFLTCCDSYDDTIIELNCSVNSVHLDDVVAASVCSQETSLALFKRIQSGGKSIRVV